MGKTQQPKWRFHYWPSFVSDASPLSPSSLSVPSCTYSHGEPSDLPVFYSHPIAPPAAGVSATIWLFTLLSSPNLQSPFKILPPPEEVTLISSTSDTIPSLWLVTAFPPHTLYIGTQPYNVSEPNIDMFVTCQSACMLLPIILSCFFLIIYVYASIWKWLFSSIMS